MSKLDFNYLETRLKIEKAMSDVEVGIHDSQEYTCLEVVFRPTVSRTVLVEYTDLNKLAEDKRLLRKIRRELLGIPWWAFWR